MIKLLLSCEHGGNYIPETYAPLFVKRHAQEALTSHRGWDWGALDLFEHLKPLSSASFFSETSRLLIDLNRSLHHSKVFSSYLKHLPEAGKEAIIDEYYLPYRSSIENQIRAWIDAGHTVWHISIHSFTPVLDGEERKADIGILYDPSKPIEKAVGVSWKSLLLNENWKTRLNYPYLGIADGLPTYLRNTFPYGYMGIEFEVNQKFASPQSMDKKIKQSVYETLKQLLQIGKNAHS